MSLLTVCQDIAESIGIPAPSTIQGNTNQDALRLKAAVNEAGRYLYQRNWPALVVDATIVGVSATNSYALPADFKGIVPATFWNTTDDTLARRNTPQNYEAIRHGFAQIAIYSQYRIRASISGEAVFIQPTPASGDTFVYRYRRSTWLLDSASTSTYSSWGTAAGDAATALVDEYTLFLEAKWRFLRKIGQPYEEEMKEARDHADREYADAIAAGPLQAGNQAKRRDFLVAITPESSVAG